LRRIINKAAVEIANQLRRHVVVEFEAFEFVIFHLSVEAERMLVDRQQAEFVRRYAHAVHRMGMQCRIQVRAGFEQTGMDDQGAALDRLYIRIRQNVAVEINLQQRGRRHLAKHPVGALDQHLIRFSRHPKSEMIVGQVVDAVMRQHAVTGREFDAGRPLLGADPIANGFPLGDELNGHDAISPNGGE
jgi:hypothetical protein